MQMAGPQSAPSAGLDQLVSPQIWARMQYLFGQYLTISRNTLSSPKHSAQIHKYHTRTLLLHTHYTNKHMRTCTRTAWNTTHTRNSHAHIRAGENMLRGASVGSRARGSETAAPTMPLLQRGADRRSCQKYQYLQGDLLHRVLTQIRFRLRELLRLQEVSRLLTECFPLRTASRCGVLFSCVVWAKARARVRVRASIRSRQSVALVILFYVWVCSVRVYACVWMCLLACVRVCLSSREKTWARSSTLPPCLLQCSGNIHVHTLRAHPPTHTHTHTHTCTHITHRR